MAVNAFISYSHADEKYLERLHKHLSMLTREKTLKAWTDHEILAGQDLDQSVDKNLNSSELFIALVSPDYLNSKYCYEIEFQQALKLAEQDKMTIVGIILEPCDWRSSPFSKFLVLPKDGKPISEWANHNNAYLNIITELRRALEHSNTHVYKTPDSDNAESMNKSVRHVKVKQEFDSIQKGDFAKSAFEIIRTYFKNSCTEINEIEDLRARFENMNDRAFTCTVVNRGVKGGHEAHITVRNSKGRGHFGDIDYIFRPHEEGNSSNGSINVGADDYNMFLTFLTMSRLTGSNEGNAKYDAQQVAELLWLDFVKQAGIDYE